MNGKTLAYIVKRLFLAVVTIFVVVSLPFWFMQLIPGGPFTSEKIPSGGYGGGPFDQEIWTG
jgi:oligopeptide transport system permease protein